MSTDNEYSRQRRYAPKNKPRPASTATGRERWKQNTAARPVTPLSAGERRNAAPTSAQAAFAGPSESKGWVDGYRQELAGAQDLWDLPQQQYRYPSGGGGGGGGGAAPVDLSKMAGSLQALLGSGRFNAQPDQNMLNAITQGVAKDRAANEGAYNSLDAWLSRNQGNAYADTKLQATPTVEPEMAQLLQSMGVDPAGYGAQVGLANTLASQSDVAGNNLMAQLAAMASDSNMSRAAESQQARTFGGQQIGAMETGLKTAVANKRREDQLRKDEQGLQVLLQLIGLQGQDQNLNVDLKGLI